MATLSFPKIIKIGSKKYKLIFTKSEARLAEGFTRASDDTSVIGFCDMATSSIVIQSDIPDTFEKHATILHECLHGISDYAGIDLTENQVIALSHSLLEFLIINKSLVKSLATVKQ